MGLILVAASGFVAYQTMQAGLAGNRGKDALERAERLVADRKFDEARQALTIAEDQFAQMSDEVGAMRWLLPAVKRTPLVGSQVVAVDTLADVGVTISHAGLGLVDAVQGVLESPTGARIGSGLLEPLGTLRDAVGLADSRLEPAAARLAALDDRWLPGPVGGAYDTVARRLPEVQDRIENIDTGLGALITFAGGSGPRQYLFLSQNPDEIRPTGGFMGTYGVLTADAGELALPRYESIYEWTVPRPEAVVPGAEAGPPFSLASPPIPQRLGNVNSTPDWPQAAELAAELWVRGGEAPVQGVVSFVPTFLARLLGPLGPVEVPEYGETVTAANLVERFAYYTELSEADPTVAPLRKDFVVALSEIVMERLLAAPSSKWDDLAQAVGEGFDQGEAMAWSTDADVAATLAERGWDAAFPESDGDFFYNGEFSYAAKNGSSLVRTFDHRVEVNGDGSGRVTTTMTISNTEERGRYNLGSLSFITLYGPSGATLSPESDTPLSEEPTLAGHPATGWLLSAPPLETATVQVAWDVPDLLQRGENGAWEYSLLWPNLPGHSSDSLNLRVDLPAGWSWKGEAPPAMVDLNRDLAGTWSLSTG